MQPGVEIRPEICLAGTAMELIQRPERMAQIREEFARAKKGRNGQVS